MEKYSSVFVILVYKNMSDLAECVASIKNVVKSDYKIIVVNAFFDDNSKIEAEKLAHSENCDFLNLDNKGYSFGNNRGIEYAIEHYEFDYLFVSNPDIVLKEFDTSVYQNGWGVIAPQICAKSGKNQNPMGVYENKLSEKCVYLGLKHDNRVAFVSGIFLGKMSRYAGKILGKERDGSRIYCAHGSFVGISKKCIDTIGIPFYDENMFLFGEEGVLAYKAKQNNMSTHFTKKIAVMHKEDGSMNMANFSIDNELKKANIYYYENYRVKDKKGNDI